MKLDQTTKTILPPDIQEGLEQWMMQLLEHREQVVSVVLFGGVAQGEFSAGGSDINLLVVVREITLELLDDMAPLLQQGVRDLRLAVLLRTEEDLRHSARLFSIKFYTMRRQHRLLYGKEVLSGLEISRTHLRLRCEQELRNLNLRLRQFYMQRWQRPELLESTLFRALSSLLTNLGVALEFKSGQAAVSKLAAIEAADQAGLDPALLREVLALKRGETKLDAGQQKQLYAAFMRAVQQAAEWMETN